MSFGCISSSRGGHFFRACYNSNISPTYRRRPVGLRMSNSVRGMQHFALSDTLHPTWASVPMFSFCYKSNISLISCRRPTLCNGHSVFALSDNLCPTRPSGLMFSLFVTIQIFLWYTVDIQSDSGCPNLRNGHSVFVLLDNLRPTQPSVPMFFLS